MTIPVKKPERSTTERESTPMVLIWWIISRILAGGRNAKMNAESSQRNILPISESSARVDRPIRLSSRSMRVF
jgi:hypothetical protein